MNVMKKLLAVAISLNIVGVAPCGSINSAVSAENQSLELSPDEKISFELSELIDALPEEKQLVYVWYENVDFDRVESIVEDNIGFGINSLEAEYDAPSTELLNELSDAAEGNPAIYLDVLMEKHLEMTENARNDENKKTELYLSEKREIISSEMTRNADSIISSAEISETDVSFKSRFVPMIICSLSSDQIKEISENSMVKWIEPYEEMNLIFALLIPI